MGSVTDNWYLSGELHIESEGSDRSDKDAWQEHFGHANIWGKFTKIATGGMWGLQNCYGILQNWDSDSLFIGLKDQGSNRKDAVIAFGDDQDDSLRFLFAGSGAPAPAPKELLRITGSGNVGLGVEVPQAILEIKGGTGGKFQFGRNNLAFEGGNEGGNLHIESREGLYLNYYSNKSIFLGQGRVGIGTTTPKGTLHLKGNEGVLSIEGADHGYIQFYPQGSMTRRGWIGSSSTGDKSFTLSSDAERMHITGGENLYLLNKGGVIVSKAWGGNGNLSVDGDIAIGGKHALRGSDPWLRLNQDGAFIAGVHTPYVFAPGSLNVGGKNGWGNPGNGNAWFTGSITYDGQLNKLDVAEGDVFARIRAHDLLFGHSSRRGEMGRALVDGGDKLFVNFGTDWKNVVIPGLDLLSTRDAKVNIHPLSEVVALKIIYGLNPVGFNYREWPNESARLGFIAEDVPDEVASDDHKAIRPDSILTALTKVVQCQQLHIERLETRLLSLESTNL